METTYTIYKLVNVKVNFLVTEMNYGNEINFDFSITP